METETHLHWLFVFPNAHEELPVRISVGVLGSIYFVLVIPAMWTELKTLDPPGSNEKSEER